MLLEADAMTGETVKEPLETRFDKEGVATISEKERVGTVMRVVALETGPLQVTPVKQHP